MNNQTKKIKENSIVQAGGDNEKQKNFLLELIEEKNNYEEIFLKNFDIVEYMKNSKFLKTVDIFAFLCMKKHTKKILFILNAFKLGKIQTFHIFCESARNSKKTL